MVKGQTLKALTAENWKQTSLAKYDSQKWFAINADKFGCVFSLQYTVCETYSNKIRGMNFFHQYGHCKQLLGSLKREEKTTLINLLKQTVLHSRWRY